MTKLCPRGKAAAKRKFKVYPSAYANAYASKICAGKIKDPSGVKRKDFRGPKPASKGAMMTAGGESAMGRIQKAKMIKAKNGKLGEAKEYKKYLKGLKNIRDKSLPGILAKPEYNPTVYDQKTFERAGGKGKAKFKDYKGLGVKNEDEFFKRRRELGGRALRAAKATRIGKIAAGVAGVGLAAKAYLNKKLEESRAKKKVDNKKMGGLKAELNNPAKGYMAGGMADYYKDLM